MRRPTLRRCEHRGIYMDRDSCARGFAGLVQPTVSTKVFILQVDQLCGFALNLCDYVSVRTNAGKTYRIGDSEDYSIWIAF